MTEQRAGRSVDALARSLEWEVIRRLGWRLAVPVLIGCAVGAGLVAWRRDALGGFLAGVMVTATVAAIAFTVVQEAGTAARRAGADAERFTSEDLTPATRAGWLRFDNVPFRGFDVDHVLVGPDRAYALETKWSASPWRDEDARLEHHLRQARINARKARLLLGSGDVGHAVEVDPVLVLWGPTDGLTTGVTVAGVHVLRGRELKDWARDRVVVPADARSALVPVGERMRRHLARIRPTEGSDDDPFYVRVGPAGLADGMAQGSIAFGLTTGAIVLISKASPWAGLGAMVVLAWASIVIARRRGRFAPAAVGAACAGLGFLVLLVGLLIAEVT